jgi:hypothetical protein
VVAGISPPRRQSWNCMMNLDRCGGFSETAAPVVVGFSDMAWRLWYHCV